MELNFKMFGEGKPVIILHGVFGMLDNWQHFAKVLSKDYWVITVDIRNHGRSPHSDIFNYDVMVSDLMQLLDKNHIKKPHIIGHSMGGKLGMHFALEHFENLQKLIVIDIGIKKTLSRHNSIFNALCSLDLSTFKNRNEIDFELEKTISIWKIRQFLLKNIIRDKENGGYKWKMNLKIIRKNYETISEAVSHDYPYEGEALFIKGEISDFILEKDKIDILELFPNAQFKTIPNSGHWVHAEETEKLIEVVKDYLN